MTDTDIVIGLCVLLAWVFATAVLVLVIPDQLDKHNVLQELPVTPQRAFPPIVAEDHESAICEGHAMQTYLSVAAIALTLTACESTTAPVPRTPPPPRPVTWVPQVALDFTPATTPSPRPQMKL